MNRSAATKTKSGRPNYFLMVYAGILVVIGIAILASVSIPLSQQKFGEPYNFLFRHILFGVLGGCLAGFLAYKIPLRFFSKWSLFLLLASLLLTALVFFPGLGIKLGGASRWLNLGFTSFQPSELLKLTSILYLASWLPVLRKKNGKNKLKVLWGFIAVMASIGILLILQPDISTLGIILICGVMIYFASGTPLWHTPSILLLGMGVLAILVKTAPYRFERITAFINPQIDPMGISYQVKQAMIAVGSGGIWGRGLGLSVQRFGFLPEPMADSIFAVFSEETGLVGSLAIVILFSLIAWQGFRIVARSEDEFSKLAGLGITCWLVLQAFLNIGSMVRLVPLTGIPLPFISYGGSAILAELTGLGILLNISRKT